MGMPQKQQQHSGGGAAAAAAGSSADTLPPWLKSTGACKALAAHLAHMSVGRRWSFPLMILSLPLRRPRLVHDRGAR